MDILVFIANDCILTLEIISYGKDLSDNIQLSGTKLI